jgi:hypothetical protein
MTSSQLLPKGMGYAFATKVLNCSRYETMRMLSSDGYGTSRMVDQSNSDLFIWILHLLVGKWAMNRGGDRATPCGGDRKIPVSRDEPVSFYLGSK